MSQERELQEATQRDVNDIVAARERIRQALDEAENTISVGRHRGFIRDVDASTDGIIELDVAADGGRLSFSFSAVDETAPDNRTQDARKIEGRTGGFIEEPDSLIGTEVSVFATEDKAYLQVESRVERALRKARIAPQRDIDEESDVGPFVASVLVPILVAAAAVSAWLMGAVGGIVLAAMILFFSTISFVLFFIPIVVTLSKLYTPLTVNTTR